MAMFENILIAVDISDEAELVVKKAKDFAEKYGSNVLLVHVVEPVVVESSYDLVPVINTDIESSLVNRSESFLNELAKKHDIDPTNTLIAIGSTKAEIHQAAKDHNTDLIVIGTHGRHGVALLLGSTANSIIHGAPCDVFCVKIPVA